MKPNATSDQISIDLCLIRDVFHAGNTVDFWDYLNCC